VRDVWKENHHILYSKVFVTKNILLPNLQIAMKYIALLFIPQGIWVSHLYHINYGTGPYKH